PPPTLAEGGSGLLTIKTDAYGVSHLFADNAYTLFYGNGYVQARDRLFQLDLLRHVGYGDSASLVGAGQLASDMQVRQSLYTREEIAQQLAAAPEWTRKALQAYSDGVNRYIAEATASGELPVEFAALGHAPEPWRPEDSVAIINYLIGFFGVSGGEELRNGRLLDTLAATTGSEAAAYAALGDMAPVQVNGSFASIPPAEKRVDGCERLPVYGAVPADQIALARKASRAVPWGVPAEANESLASVLGTRTGLGLLDGFHWGSNALIVDGAHSTTGQPIMFGGPQMLYYKPPVPYQIGLHGAGFDVTGIGVAGAPGVVIGRTPTFAWSVTSGYDDMLDTVVLHLDESDPHRYEWDGTWRTMECREEIHRTTPSPGNARAPQLVRQEVCRAEGMPVLAWSPQDRLAWAQRTTTRMKELEGASYWLALGAQKDLTGFMGTLSRFPFTFNFLYAGPEGIAYVHTGAVPLRYPALDPRLPALPGSAHGWRGEAVGLGLGTSIVNPAQGYVVQWNNAPAEGWRAGDGHDWAGHHRAELLDHLVRLRLAATGGHLSLADMEGLVKDAATRDPFARHTVPHLVAAARASGEAALAPLADALDAWAAADYPYADADGDGRYDHPGHAIWDAARGFLQASLLGDELGAETPTLHFDPSKAGSGNGNAGAHDGFDGDMVLVKALEGRAAHAWCDVQGTPAAETCPSLLVAALQE
ncbi:MAG TPA: penicillin acylase family protein, partial [Candidatus Thermoplasmatota archaeon]|nr:penicillin acylase family protein [Candidatus Thermoplasmatota archaeon]